MTDQLKTDIANLQSILDAAVKSGIISDLISAANLASSFHRIIEALKTKSNDDNAK